MASAAKPSQTMISPAAARFFNIPELLIYLGEVVVNRKLLLDLCLTSKSFNAAFTPFLYTEIWLNEGNVCFFLEQLDILLANRALKHTKTLDFCIALAALRSDSQTDVHICQLLNETIQAILGKTPNLTKFSWEKQPLYATTISTLHSKCPNLKSLTISHILEIEQLRGTAFEHENFHFEDGLNELRPLFETQDFSPFANLTELEMHEIHGDLSQARSEIVKILIASPDLRTLSLSLNSETVIRLDQEAQEISEMGEYLDFFQTLIHDFVAAGGRPLSLRKLVLGLCIVLWEEDEQQLARYLGGLTDLSKLEEAYICNNGIDTQLYFGEPDGIAWCTFSMETCPSLTRFGLHNFTDEVEEWIQGLEPGYLSQLTIEDTLGHDVSEIRPALEANDRYQSSTLRMLALVGFDAGSPVPDYLLPLEIPGLQALSVTLLDPGVCSKPELLSWISESQSLQQFCLDGCWLLLGGDGSHDTLAEEIVAEHRQLRYLKLDQHAWRIWYTQENEGEDCYRLEKLDRFEQMRVEAFRRQRSFHVAE